jgi:YebC/PmpR family DNA-binding regulatory protein
VETTTDNRNRTVSEVRNALSKNGGNLGELNSVSWMFSKKGLLIVPKSAAPEDKLMEVVLEAGGDDIRDEGDNWEIYTDPASFTAVQEAIKNAKIETTVAEVTMVASTYTNLEGAPANAMLRLLDALDDLDDVQNVYSNFDMDEKAMEHAAH